MTMEHVCVGGLLVERRAVPRLLLGRRAASRGFYPDVWDVPGGHCAPGEAPEQTLVREFQEELGITPTAWQPLGTFRSHTQGSDEGVLLYLYAVTEWTGTPHNRSPAEHAEVAWFSVDDASRLALAHRDYAVLFRCLVAATMGARTDAAAESSAPATDDDVTL